MTSPTPEYVGPERRALTKEDVAEMRQATQELTERVGTLSEALSVVNDLQSRQMDLEQRTTDLAAVAKETKDTVVDQHALTEHVVEHLDTLDAVGAKRQRLLVRIRKLVLLGAVLIFLGMVTGGVLIYEVHRINTAVMQSCNSHNTSIRGAITREQALSITAPVAQRPAHLASVESLRESLQHC